MSEKSKVLDTLKIVIEDFQKEYDALKKTASEKDVILLEKERYLASFIEKEESDFKLFSPRNIESVYIEEIEEKNNEIDDLSEEKKIDYKKMGFLSSHINKLNVVYENLLEQGGNNLAQKEDIEQEYIKRFHNCDRENFDYRLLVMDMQEKERQRMARELHDTTIQDLTHVIHILELTKKFSEQDPVRSRMELMTASKAIRETIDDLRNRIFDLRPMTIDDLGYKETFTRLKVHIESISEMKISFSFDEISKKDSLDSLILYRIIQECCMNAVKHSKGTKIEVSLKIINKEIFLKVIDNGVGFNVSELEKNREHNFGLEMTRERANLLNGKMKIISGKDIGTTIIVTFPKKSIR